MDIQIQVKDVEQYTLKISDRINFLEQSSNKALLELVSLTEKQKEFDSFTKSSLDSLKSDLDNIKNNLDLEVKNILKLVDQFKKSLDKAKFASLKQRIDFFKGESFVSRKEFKKWIEEDLS